jgi:hypothetical protein
MRLHEAFRHDKGLLLLMAVVWFAVLPQALMAQSSVYTPSSLTPPVAGFTFSLESPTTGNQVSFKNASDE